MWVMVFGDNGQTFVTRDDMARMAYEHKTASVSKAYEQISVRIDGIAATFIAPRGTTWEDLRDLGINL